MRFHGSLLALIALLPGFIQETTAQSEMSLYRFGHSVPQAGLINPSFIPDYKVVIGLPMLSHYGFADNDELAFRDLFVRETDGSLALDEAGLPEKLGDIRRQRIDIESQLLMYGVRIAGFYFTIGGNLNTQLRLTYPGELLGWAIRGPADPYYENSDLELDDFSVDALMYHEYYASAARSFFNRLSLGVRFRYIIGLASARSEEFDGSLHVGADSISIVTSRMVLNTGGISFFDQDDLGIRDYASYGFDSRNRGGAIDLGASFKINDRIVVSAAVNDVGYIRWRDYTRKYELDPINYSFKGFDVIDYLFENDTTDIDAELDELETLFEPNEVDGQEFTTPLVTRVYGGISYRVGKRHEFGLVGFTDINRGTLNPGAGLSYSLKLGRMVQAVIGGTYSNGQLINVGAGLSLKLGPLQIYGVSDRANGIVYPARTSWVNARAGVNLVFGRIKDQEKARADSVEQAVEQPEEEPEEREVEPDSVVPEMELATEPDSMLTEVQPEVVVEEIPRDTIQEQQPAVIVPETEFVPTGAREVVTRGTHPEELPAGHYVIVGVFRGRENAVAYSNQLQAANFYNSFGYLSEREAYYVQVYYSKDDPGYVRRVRDQYRQMQRFQFKDAWFLSVTEGN